jgi:hypothetical protein
MSMIGLAKWIHPDLKVVKQMSEEERAARLLGAFCQSALQNLSSGGLAVDYRELPEAVPGRIANHFGWAVTGEATQRMLTSSHNDSKDVGKTFQGDSHEKQTAAGAATREAAERWIWPLLSRMTERLHHPTSTEEGL